LKKYRTTGPSVPENFLSFQKIFWYEIQFGNLLVLHSEKVSECIQVFIYSIIRRKFSLFSCSPRK
jgi:hypothetical protein